MMLLLLLLRMLLLILLLSLQSLAMTTRTSSTSSSSRNNRNPPSSSSLAKLRHAMQLSNDSTRNNITAAMEACHCWADLLPLSNDDDDEDEDDDSSGTSSTTSSTTTSTSFAMTRGDYDDTVLGLSLALYGSCLVRIGQDARAVQVFQRALSLNNTTNNNGNNKRHGKNRHDELRISKAQALQRLLNYDKAREEFQKVLESSSSSSSSVVGAMGAATCSLRLGDLPTAIEALKTSHRGRSDDETEDSTAALQGLLGVAQYLFSGNLDEEPAGVKGIRSAAAREPLYRWIQAALRLSDSSSSSSSDPIIMEQRVDLPSPFLSLIQINTCPLDDPSLLLLDDKVHLHRLLSKYPQAALKFWPNGRIVVPSGSSSSHENGNHPNVHVHDDASSSPEGNTNARLYILKERSGYGSHGNRILSASEAAGFGPWREDDTTSETVVPSSSQEEKLLQQMVDYPLLLHGRKFSLRIYVIYFSPTEVYLSSDGLVKLASVRMDNQQQQEEEEESSSSSSSSSGMKDPRRHMTNSGRDVAMEQHSLSYLQAYLEDHQGESSYSVFWNKIAGVVEDVFDCYKIERTGLLLPNTEQWDCRREGLGIPKILGFDFVVSDDGNNNTIQPWLVEINRFPGMEPRDESDRMVKYQVVHDAWMCAGERVLSDDKNMNMKMKNHPLDSLLQPLVTTSSSSSSSTGRRQNGLQALNTRLGNSKE
jgi:tetratricopeptide (TPR) repeat protein